MANQDQRDESSPGLMSYEELNSIVKSELSDAVDYVNMEIGADRAEASKYYLGDLAILRTEDSRSTVISNDVRDTVQAILPSLMRVLLGAPHCLPPSSRVMA